MCAAAHDSVPSGDAPPSPPPPRPAGRTKSGAGSTAASADAPPSAPPPSPRPRRRCGKSGCTKSLPKLSHDAHTVCISCRRSAGLQCSPGSRCDECVSWPEDQVLSAHSFQLELGSSKSKPKCKAPSPANKAPAASPPAPPPPPPTTNDQVTQQLVSLVSGGVFREALTSFISDTVKSMLPDMSLTASSVTRPDSLTPGLSYPPSAPTDMRYHRSPVGRLRGVAAGPEPTEGDGGDTGSTSTALLPPPLKRPCVAAVDSAGQPPPACPTAHGLGHDPPGWHNSQQGLTIAPGEGTSADGFVPDMLWPPPTQTGVEVGSSVHPEPPPPMSRAPTLGTAAPWSHVRLPTIHLGAGGAALLSPPRAAPARLHDLLQPGGASLPPPPFPSAGSGTLGVGAAQAAALPSSATTAGSEAGLLLHRPPLLAASTSQCDCSDRPLRPAPPPHLASPSVQPPPVRADPRDGAGPSWARDDAPPQSRPLSPSNFDLEDYASAQGDAADAGEGEASLIGFRSVLDFVCETFPDARADVHQDRMPLAPGMPSLSAPPSFVSVRQSDLVDFALQQASVSLQQSASSSRPAFVPIPSLRAYQDPGARSKPAALNPDLAAQLHGTREPRFTASQRDLAQLEMGLLASLKIQNWLIWFVGTFVKHASPVTSASSDAAMMERLLASINRAFTSQARVSASTLANIRLMRREAFISVLPSRFQAAAKRTLRCSPLHHEFLFGPDQVAEASHLAKEAASFSLSEATARALARPAPRPGTPLGENRSSRSFRSGAPPSSTIPRPRDRAPSATRPRGRAASRPSFPARQGSSRLQSDHGRSQRTSRR